MGSKPKINKHVSEHVYFHTSKTVIIALCTKPWPNTTFIFFHFDVFAIPLQSIDESRFPLPPLYNDITSPRRHRSTTFWRKLDDSKQRWKHLTFSLILCSSLFSQVIIFLFSFLFLHRQSFLFSHQHSLQTEEQFLHESFRQIMKIVKFQDRKEMHQFRTLLF